jgi:hypothetical protein
MCRDKTCGIKMSMGKHEINFDQKVFMAKGVVYVVVLKQ